MTTGQLAAPSTVTASTIGVVGPNFGTINLTAAHAPSEYIRGFGSLIDELAHRVVGREEILNEIASFGGAGPLGNDRGFLLLEGDAGLGKTSLAAAICRQQDALPFFFGTGGGESRWDECLRHLCALVITRSGMRQYATLPPDAERNWNVLIDLLDQAVRAGSSAIWIVLDAIDEVPGPAVLPDRLPRGTFLVITRRPVDAPLGIAPDMPFWSHRLQPNSTSQQQALRRMLEAESAAGTRAAQALSAADPPVDAATFVARALAAIDGNFMYARYLLNDVIRHSPGTPLNLEELPSGLPGYYETFWRQMEQVKGTDRANWSRLYRPVIERLAVAMQPVTAQWLADQVGADQDDVRDLALNRWERFLVWSGAGNRQTWSVVHRSFADFLATKVDLAQAHRLIVDHTFGAHAERFAEWDSYALRFAGSHLVRAAAASAQPDRQQIHQQLVDLVTSDAFRAEHARRLDEPAALQRDLELALQACADDSDPGSAAMATRAALVLVDFRQEQLRSDAVFELAREGKIEEADQRLALVAAAADLDVEWHLALRLVIAWLAPPSAFPAARALRSRVEADARSWSGLLDYLNRRVQAQLDTGVSPPTPPAELGPPATAEKARAMVARLRGEGFDGSLLGGPGGSSSTLGEMLGANGGYQSAEDGPPLVAYALSSGDDHYLQEYLEIHNSYGYRTYRNGSLWSLLASVLLHPLDAWAREWSVRLGMTALSPGVEFREGLGFALLAARAMCGDATARATLDDRRTAAVVAADPRHDDPWSLNRRRVGVLAEVYAWLDGQPAGARRLRNLLSGPQVAAIGSAAPRGGGRASYSARQRTQRGFAGFRAPAFLCLAETAEIVRTPELPGRLVSQALRAAHNIQDPVFCARTTARVETLRNNWPPGKADLMATVERLRQDPSAAEFATVHRVGEKYRFRDTRLTDLPASLLEARSLADLAVAFGRPLADLLRVNGVDPRTATTPLALDKRVLIPDPGFIPLLAARLAAAALGSSLPVSQRVRAIQALVPLATPNLTALDTVLTRLLLARSYDLADLDRIDPLVAAEQPAELNPNLPRIPA